MAPRRSLALAVLLIGAVTAVPAAAQQDSTRADSLRADSALADSLGQPLDTAVAARLGLPTSPSRSFPSPDSIIRALQAREGYRSTRYASDSLTFFAQTREIALTGDALVEREGMTLEADSVRFLQAACALLASGEPKVFEQGTVLIGEQMSYDTCLRQGLVREALTNFEQSGVDWYLRGGLGIDSAAVRLYAGDGEITSCDLADPHYHFQAGRVKWVSNSILVARPAKLYVRDVPVLWLPFLFQDMRQGRRTGLLTPRFGINDIVRPNEGYRRHITNVGFYFVLNDYLDFQASLDWFARTSVSLNGQLQYRWLNRFIDGGISVSRIFESSAEGSGGRTATQLSWNHQQSFNQRTRLSANVQFATSSSVLEENSIDPAYQISTLQSSVNFSKQMDWGSLNMGGRASQDLSNDEVQITFPQVAFTPVPISIGGALTWSPSFNLNTQRNLNQRRGTIPVPPLDGVEQPLDTLFVDNRTTTFSMGTPIRIGSWTWQNSFQVQDVLSDERRVVRIPDPENPADTVTRVYGERFSTQVDWNTSIGLPILFPASWKLSPSVGIQNSTSGPFLLRNEFTNGEFVQQGKRLSFAASVSPALFAFFPGLGPLERIRHSFSPQISWNYAPAANVPEAFARGLDPTNPNPRLRSMPLHTISLGMSNTFEGKFELEEGADTTSQAAQQARKLKILNLQTSSISYNFEQAKEPGRNGWTTQNISGALTSDLVRGLSLRAAYDLWDGPVGFDTTDFDPFLTSVSTRFSISGRTFARFFGALFGGGALGPPDPEEQQTLEADTTGGPQFQGGPIGRGRSTSFPGADAIAGRGQVARGRGFQASVTYDLQRRRTPDGTEEDPLAPPSTNQTLGLSTSFSPTENWSVQYTTQYNFTTKEFGQHVLRFDRDLHRWRATFSVIKSPNGNFAFNFFINLLDQPEIKFNYDQRSVN